MVSPGKKAHRPKVAYVPPPNWQGLSGVQWHGEPVLHSVRAVAIGIGVAAAADGETEADEEPEADGETELDPAAPPQADRTSAVPRTTRKIGRFLMPITGTTAAGGLSAPMKVVEGGQA